VFGVVNSYLQGQTSVMLGYQFDLPKANFSMKGSTSFFLLFVCANFFETFRDD
jgi:hypothetical protein